MKHNHNFDHTTQSGIFVQTFRTVLRRHSLLTFGMVFFIICSVMLALVPPLILEQLINCLTAGNAVRLSLILLYFVVLSVSGLSEAVQNVLITVFGQKITHTFRRQMCHKLSRLPASYFTANEPGKITSRFVNDVDAVDALFTNGVVSMFADCCKVLSIFVVIFWKSKGLGILMLLLIPLLFLLTRSFQKRMLRAQTANRTAVERVNNHIPETIRNIRMIHTLHRQKYMEQKYDSYIQDSYRAVERSNLYDSVYSPIIIFTSSFVIGLMMVLSSLSSGMQSFFGMSVGTAVAVISYVGKVFSPLESIGMEIQNIQSAVAGVHRIQEFMAEPEQDKEIPQNVAPVMPDAVICFDHVTFGYAPGQPVVTDLTFTLRSGEYATLAGRTGAGKSTILRLLLGLYQPDKGQIVINGIPAGAIPDSDKRTLFGYVEQTFHPVPGTIADQITLHDSRITREQVQQAARLTGIHEAILLLKHGYDTPLAEAAFSQGQLQLLSIARAVAANPAILLLDEITASLDSDTERRVMEALDNASRDRTVLSVSHRLYEKTLKGTLIHVGAE